MFCQNRETENLIKLESPKEREEKKDERGGQVSDKICIDAMGQA